MISIILLIAVWMNIVMSYHNQGLKLTNEYIKD